MGHQLWWKVPRMIASIDCPSPCWLGKPRNVQPDFAQLVLLFLLAWSRKERKAHEWPIPGGRTWFCFCLVRPLRSHYWLCSSLYPQGNPIHWDSRLDHHQTQEWVLNQWNVCFYLSSSPLLIKSQSQVVVETRGQINLWGHLALNLSSFWSIVWIPLRRLSFFLLMDPKEVILRRLLPSDLVG